MPSTHDIILPPELPLARPRDAIQLRICSTDYVGCEPNFRNTKKYRFDDPKGIFGTLYCSPAFLTCYYETVVRDSALDSSGRYIPISKTYHDSRSLVQILVNWQHMRLVNLMDDGAAQMGLDASVLMGSRYRQTQAIARAIYDHPSQVHGAVYRSRFDMQSTAVVLFDRAGPFVRLYPAAAPVTLVCLDELIGPLKVLPVPIALV